MLAARLVNSRSAPAFPRPAPTPVWQVWSGYKAPPAGRRRNWRCGGRSGERFPQATAGNPPRAEEATRASGVPRRPPCGRRVRRMVRSSSRFHRSRIRYGRGQQKTSAATLRPDAPPGCRSKVGCTSGGDRGARSNRPCSRSGTSPTCVGSADEASTAFAPTCLRSCPPTASGRLASARAPRHRRPAGAPPGAVRPNGGGYLSPGAGLAASLRISAGASARR